VSTSSIYRNFIFNENNPKDREDIERAIDYLYKDIIIPLGGSVTGEHGIGVSKLMMMPVEHQPKVLELKKKIFFLKIQQLLQELF